MTNIAVLGDGVTARSVLSQLPRLGHNEVDMSLADCVIASPGLPPSEYPATSVPIYSEIEFAYHELMKRPHPPQLIAVTGTNGKSTVTSLIAHILEAPACGNIGTPLIEFVTYEGPFLVVEVSSYQLEQSQTFIPFVSIFLNLTPDHLGRHGTMDAYADAKCRLVKDQKEGLCIADMQNAYYQERLASCEVPCVSLSLDHPDLSRLEPLQLVGPHHQLNYLAAYKAAEACGIPHDTIIERMMSFTPLPHRLEFVGSYDGRSFYNDSKATNPESVLAAVRSFKEPIHLLLSGDDKGLDLSAFVQEVHPLVDTVTTFGGISEQIVALFSNFAPHKVVSMCSGLGEAIDSAFHKSEPGSVILLSPSSSSFDCFKNFEDRGDQFRSWVTNTYLNQ